MSTQSLDPRAFRQALGQFATGVTIITTATENGDRIGLTANSFSSVSLEPPLVLWSLDKKARSLSVFEQQDHFAIHVLAHDQMSLSNLFASKVEDKFEGLTIEQGPGKIPLLTEYAARFVCKKTYAYEGGDHIIFVGEVLEYDCQDNTPLLFHAGQYAQTRPHAHIASKQLEDKQQEEAESGFTEDFLMYLSERANAQLVAPFHQMTNESGISTCGMHILALLSAISPRSINNIKSLNPMEQACIDTELTQLAGKKMLTLENDEASITQLGRQHIVKLLAAGKAFEADALQDLDGYEQQLFKDMLKRVINRTNPGIPDPFSQ